MDCFKIFFVIVQLAAIARISVCEEISDRCKILQTTEMKRICIGKYPMEISYRYRDALMDIGAKYAIFQFIDRSGSHYYIAHFSSPLMGCVKAKAIKPLKYSCTTEDDKTEEIEIRSGIVMCLTENMHMADELLTFCGKEQMNPSEFVVLQYTIGPKSLTASSTNAAAFRMHSYLLVATILFVVE
uniref:Protein RecA n=1 Tax=Zeugodacus cucurbitae TaxID=28588 RepID=A0A0A1XT75_ZEUCU